MIERAPTAVPDSIGDQVDPRVLRIIMHGTDAPLKLESFECEERMSSLYTMTAQATAPRDEPETNYIGHKVTVQVNLFRNESDDSDVETRRFTGIVIQQEFHDEDEDRPYYNFVIAPWLWLLSRRADCRIFQNMRVEAIVEQIIGELIGDFPQLDGAHDRLDNRVRAARTERDYCVQYNETTLNFVLRLLEEEGIGFYFEHTDRGVSMVLFDGNHQTFPTCPYRGEVTHLETTSSSDLLGHLLSWNSEQILVPDRYALRDHHFDAFNFSSAKRDAFDNAGPGTANPFGPTIPPTTRLEVFEYGEGFAEPFINRVQQPVIGEGDRRAQWRLQAERAERMAFEGSSSCHDFAPGFLFQRKVEGSFDPHFPLLLTEVRHSAHVQRSHDGEIADTRLCYYNHFRCIPSRIPFRPRPATPKPAIYGVQTARVAGPGGSQPAGDAGTTGNVATTPPQDDIHVDEFGRVRVQFLWDRRDVFDDRSSCWIRVGQGWASGGFGMHFWPRVGDEVIVAFLNGDPDRPLIVGSVYNSANMPPYELSEHKTRSGIKTRSSPGGTAENFNEIRFEDRKGHEQVYIHAERNLKTVVEASESRSVGGSRSTTIGHDDTLTVKKGNRTADVEEGNDSLSVLKGSRLTTVDEGDDFLRVPLGTRRVETDVYELQADTRINLTVGASNIVMEGDSIQLSVAGTSIRLDATMLQLIASQIQSTALGPHEVRGLPVKINC